LLKKSFFSGLVLLLPIAITLAIVWWFVDLFTYPFSTWVCEALGVSSRSPVWTGLIAPLIVIAGLLVGMTLAGFLIQLYTLRTFTFYVEWLLNRIPLVRQVYSWSRELIILLSKQKNTFSKVVLVPFAGSKQRVVALMCVQKPLFAEGKVSVFVPTSPHPLSGFLILCDPKDVKETTLSIEEAMKFSISCGLMCPNEGINEVISGETSREAGKE